MKSHLGAEADALLDRANADPAGVAAEGPELAKRADDAGEPAAAAVACRAVGLAEARLSRVGEALEWLERGRRRARAARDRRLRASVDVTYAAVLSWSGETGTALDVLAAALRASDGPDRARALAQRGQIRLRMGRFRSALADLDEALPELEAAGDRVWRARALTNRGLALSYVGSLAAAERDLLAAQAAYEDEGAASYVAETLDNLGWVNAQRGDIVRALTFFDRAEALLGGLGYPLGQLLRDRSEALLAANLTEEALASAQRASAELGATRLAAGYLEALATLARAALAAGEPALAAGAADELASEAGAQARDPLAWHGRLLALEARRAAGAPPSLGEVARVADRLAASGLATPALSAALLAAEVALDAGRVAAARRWLERVPVDAGRAPLPVRVRAHLARARLHLADHAAAAASRALGAGMAAVEQHQASLGATETRAAVAGYGAELGRLGMQMAAHARRPRRLLAWMERTRASALRFPPAGPPADPDFAAAMARLRWVEARLHEAADPRSIARLSRARARLEAELARRSRRIAGAGDRARPAAVDELLEALGGAALVMYGGLDGELHAVVAHRGRVRHRILGDVAEVRTRLIRLRGALRRLGAAPARPPGHGAAAADDRTALGALLLEGLRLPDVPVVVVPPPGLFAVPWGLLGPARGRPLTVAPSGSAWLACSGRAAGPRVLLANGPRLSHGARETAGVARVYGGPTRLTSRQATVERLRTEIGRHDVVHVVAHGHLRADNPQFSALELTDGPLNVFDLESIDRSPGLMVLSSCDGGLTAELPGNEIMGLVACLLAQGTGAVVAGVGLVPDAGRTAAFMRGFHERVAAGAAPAAALAAGTERLDPDDLADAALAGFVCFGGGA